MLKTSMLLFLTCGLVICPHPSPLPFFSVFRASTFVGLLLCVSARIEKSICAPFSVCDSKMKMDRSLLAHADLWTDVAFIVSVGAMRWASTTSAYVARV
jgi:hypothetical protein